MEDYQKYIKRASGLQERFSTIIQLRLNDRLKQKCNRITLFVSLNEIKKFAGTHLYKEGDASTAAGGTEARAGVRLDVFHHLTQPLARHSVERRRRVAGRNTQLCFDIQKNSIVFNFKTL